MAHVDGTTAIDELPSRPADGWPHRIEPAAHYEAADDLAVVCCFFNSEDFASKQWAFEAFWETMARSPLAVFTAEVAFDGREFVTPSTSRLVSIRDGDVMWQKERLLNLLVPLVPPQFTKIAWLDADILFENPAWAAQTARLLDDHAVVQPYSHCYRLERGAREYRGDDGYALSFLAVQDALPMFARYGGFGFHGHTGYAWAARREVLEEAAFYDAAIAGLSDHMMAHAYAGDFDAPCLRRIFEENDAYLAHFQRWAVNAFTATGGRLSYVDGASLHLWHGELVHRGYTSRSSALNAAGFDPDVHLALDDNGLWAWTPAASQVRQVCRDIFAARREDSDD